MIRTMGLLALVTVALAPALTGAQDVRPGGAASRELELELTGGALLKVVRIEPGKFVMGSQHAPNETPHEVEITKPFLMGVYAVTQNQYRQVMGNNPSHFS